MDQGEQMGHNNENFSGPNSHAKIFIALGNGDFQKGYKLAAILAESLVAARKKHSWGKNCEIDTYLKASIALQDEHSEWTHAMIAESEQRQAEEAMDMLTVAARIVNREYE